MPALLEWMLVYGTPAMTYLIDGLLYAWFCGKFGKSRLKNGFVTMVVAAVLWLAINGILSVALSYDITAHFGIQLLLILLRFIVTIILFELEKDRLVFVVLFFTSIYGMVKFLTGNLVGLFEPTKLLIWLSHELSISGNTFFALNNAFVLIEVLGAELLAVLLTYIFCKGVCKVFRNPWRHFKPAELTFLLLPPVAGWVECRILYFLINRQSPTSSIPNYSFIWQLSLFMVALLLLMSVANILVYQKLDAALRNNAKHTILERQNADLKHHLAEVTHLNLQLRSLKHDVKNHISVLSRLIAQVDGHEELKEYLSDFSLQAEKLDAHFSTGLASIDALLDGKEFELKKRMGQDCTIDAENLIFPKDILVREYDIAVILGNAIDNAIEACERKTEPPDIAVLAKKRGNMLLMEVINNFDGGITENSFSGFPKTDKKDGENHGMGVYNMKITAEKYHGTIDWQTMDGKFILTILMQNMKPEQ